MRRPGVRFEKKRQVMAVSLRPPDLPDVGRAANVENTRVVDNHRLRDPLDTIDYRYAPLTP